MALPRVLFMRTPRRYQFRRLNTTQENIMKTPINTSDIVLASTLSVLGHKIESITVDGAKGTFYFTDVDADVIHKYDIGHILVEPVAFNGAIKRLTTSVRRLTRPY